MFFGGFPFGDEGGMGGGMGGGRGRRGGGEVDNTKFYKVLEVSKNASSSEIKKAYRKMAMKHHPDKGGDQDLFKEIGRAYEVLSDPEKKQKYDQYGEEGLDGEGGGDASDIFDMFFGGGGGRRGGGSGKKKGKDLIHPLEVTLEQLYSGFTKKLAINRDVVDPNVPVRECQICNGRGVRIQVVRMGPMVQQMQTACNDCQGQGKSYTTKKEREVLEVYIDKGAADGHKIPFRGKADEKPGYETGDVIFVVNEKEHAVFKRKGADLYINKTITLLEALVGFEIEVTHLDGRKLLIKNKPGEIITPRKEVDEDSKWEIFNDTDVVGEVVAKAQATDVEQLKQAAQQKGFSGFVVDASEGRSFFWQMSRNEILKNKKSDRSSKGKRLYLCPDPVEMSQARMLKAVKNEGMPTLRNPMLRGNLFIKLEIEFPESLGEKSCKLLKTVLPVPKNTPMIDEEQCEHHFVDNIDPEESAKERGDNGAAYDEDDESHGHGGQRVQCAQQ
eukprot:GEMP01005813.1.p1 GENE.GEMP01005813.1~~GEMP01005813.1.p1  ORF type:complete len:500 (+),score=116.50 GEMP01005813.1:41-1540(+)